MQYTMQLQLYRCVGEYIHTCTCSQKGVSVPMQPNLSYRLSNTSYSNKHRPTSSSSNANRNRKHNYCIVRQSLHSRQTVVISCCIHKYHSNTRKSIQENYNNLGPCVWKQTHRLLHISPRSTAFLGGNYESTMVKVALIF